MSNTATGKIIHIGETEYVSDAFKKRIVVIETDEKYPQQVPFEFVQKSCELLDGCAVGQTATIAYNLRGREWQGRYFVNLNGWKIDASGDAGPDAQPDDPTYDPGPGDENMPL